MHVLQRALCGLTNQPWPLQGQEEVEHATLILGCLQVYGMVPRLVSKRSEYMSPWPMP